MPIYAFTPSQPAKAYKSRNDLPCIRSPQQTARPNPNPNNGVSYPVMAPGRRETPRYVPCDCPVTLCRAPYRRPNLPCSAPPTTTRAAPFTLLYTRQEITAPLCFLSSPADFAGIRADSPCKRRRAPPRAPRGVAVTRYTAGNSGPRSAVTPEVPAHRRPRGPGAPPSGTHRPHLGAILGETASSAKNLFPTNSFV